MTNREWLNKLSDKELAGELHGCKQCAYNGKFGCERPEYKNCVDGIMEWLNSKHDNPMPEIEAGDYIFYEYSDVIYRAFCISGKLIFLIDRGVCTRFDGEIKQRTVAIKRYNPTKETMEDIWRADNE